jgi:hypothetical protein
MPVFPDIDSLTNYGGALNDYQGIAVIDPTTDRSAAGMNQALESAAAMTWTVDRACAVFGFNGSSAPTLINHFAGWGNSPGVAPMPARASLGLYTCTWPATVNDEIPSNAPGYASPHTLNFRASRFAINSGATPYFIQQVSVSANVLTFCVFSSAGSLVDPPNTVSANLFVL